jgi:hypothetical protein
VPIRLLIILLASFTCAHGQFLRSIVCVAGSGGANSCPVGGGTGSSYPSSTATISGVQNGDTVIVYTAGPHVSGGCSDGVNTYAQIVAYTTGLQQYMFAARSVTGGSLTVTCTFSSNFGYVMWVADFYLGPGGAGTTDVSGSDSSASMNSVSVSLTTTHPTDLIIAMVRADSVIYGFTPTSPYIIPSGLCSNSSTGQCGIYGYLLESTSGTSGANTMTVAANPGIVAHDYALGNSCLPGGYVFLSTVSGTTLGFTGSPLICNMSGAQVTYSSFITAQLDQSAILYGFVSSSGTYTPGFSWTTYNGAVAPSVMIAAAFYTVPVGGYGPSIF